MVKKLLTGMMIFCIMLVLVSSVYAITGSIGNARMILKASVGDKIDKYILVKNVNNVSVNVQMYATDGISQDIVIQDKNFTLLPGDEKKAYFTINVKKEGESETNMNVKFTPIDGKNGIGLSAKIILVATKGSSGSTLTGLFGLGKNNSNQDPTPEETPEDPSDPENNGDNPKINFTPVGLAVMITAIIFIVFIVLLVVSKNVNKKKVNKIGGETEVKTKRRVKGHE